MQVFPGSKSVVVGSGPYAVGIGIFDGVHIGHRALLSRVVELARADGIASLAYTFHPHPAHLLSSRTAPLLIEPIETRLERLASMGFDATLVEPFDHDFASMTAVDFVRRLLVDRLQARHVIVGADFAFGRGRGGDVSLLQTEGAALGFMTHPTGLVSYAGEPVSSTRIRKLVAAGEVRRAAELLDRPFALSGVVLRGHRRGVGMGFGTANIEPHHELMPMAGVYAARVSGPVDAAPAVVNVGYAPTFGVNRLRVEAHILDFPPRPLYGSTIVVDFIERLRDEMRFSGIEALVAQIGVDVAAAQRILAKADT